MTESNPLLAAALEYVQGGWHVFPLYDARSGRCACEDPACEHPGKHRRTAHGLLDATLDENQIRKWWRRWPKANIGIATEPSRLIVLDIDPRNDGDESMRRLVAEHRALNTLAAVSGGGGDHYYFHATIAATSRTNALGSEYPGIDVKARGGYVIAPPSVHISGGSYEWEVSSPEELATVPQWLATLLQRHECEPIAGADDYGPIVDGQRNVTLARLAGRLRRQGMTARAIEDALLAMNARQCKPPLPKREVKAIARSVGRYAPAADRAANQSLPPRARLKLTVLSEVTVRRVEWLEPGYVPKATMTLMEGDGDLGKTTLLTGLLAAHSRGERFFPVDAEDAVLYPIEPATILITAREDDHATLKARLREAGAVERHIIMVDGRELSNEHGLIEEADGSIYLPRDIALLEAAIQDTKATIVYIDALHSHVTVDEPKDPVSVRKAYHQIVELLRRTGATLLATRHWGKGTGRAHDRGLGSSEIGHIARAVLSFALHPHEPERYVVTQTKKNLSRAMPTIVYAIESIPVTDDFGLQWTVPKVKVLGTDEGITPDDVALAMPIGPEERHRKGEAQEAMIRAFAGVDTIEAKDLDAACEGMAPRTVERARAEFTREGVLKRGKVGMRGGPVTYTLCRQRLAFFAKKYHCSPLSENGEEHEHMANNDGDENGKTTWDGMMVRTVEDADKIFAYGDERIPARDDPPTQTELEL